jgi:[ribosomal protein S5]-alanine N-acetyltransferase
MFNSLPIVTQRLTLKPISVDYAEDIFREFDRQVTRFTYSEPNESLECAIEFIQNARVALLNGSAIQLVILNRETQEFLGGCGILALNKPNPEMGIWLKKSVHRRGYGKEAIEGLRQWAKQNLKYEYIIYAADRLNLPSQRIAESLGGKLVDNFTIAKASGQVLDLLEYRFFISE